MTIKLKHWVRGFTAFELSFLAILTAMQIIVFVLTPDNWLNIVAGLSGVFSVVLCAKGRISFYYIGFVQTVSYLFLSFQNRFYGEVIENTFYLVTMIIGVFLWKKNMTKNEDGTKQVTAKKFSIVVWVVSVCFTGFATMCVGWGLTLIDSQQAYTDAATNVIAIFAQILMLKRYKEQWIWWLVLNLLCIKMWFVAGNWSMVVMYIGWTANCIYGWYNWSKLAKTKLEH